MAIIKHNTVNQIPLFELPPQKSADQPVHLHEEQAGEPAKANQDARKSRKPAKGGAKGARKQAPRAMAKDARVAPVPEGDVRLTANIRQELHLRLKIVAATRRTTIGELIEELVEQYL